MPAKSVYLLVTMTLAASALSAVVYSRVQQRNRNLQVAIQHTRDAQLHITSKEVIGSAACLRGNAQAPYTLVEFTDYQCPSCVSADKRMGALLQSYAGKIKLTVRNFPLPMHPYARPAALAAEAAKAQGKYWEMHTALFRNEGLLDTQTIDEAVRSCGLNRAKYDRAYTTTASAAVDADLRMAQWIDLPGTPAFVLCCPDGRVIRLSSLDHLRRFVP